MKLLKKIGRGIVGCHRDLPAHQPCSSCMFVVFLINIFTRYVLRNPQNWTFEFSVNSFVIVGLLGACAAYRLEDHVVFDLVYTRLQSPGPEHHAHALVRHRDRVPRGRASVDHP